MNANAPKKVAVIKSVRTGTMPAPPQPYDQDVGAAARFSQMFRDKLIYVPQRGRWLEFIDGSWSVDEIGKIYQYAERVSADLLLDASTALAQASKARLADDRKSLTDKANRLTAAAARLRQKPRIDAMLALAETRQGIAVSQEDLDAGDMRLGVQGGVLELHKLPVVHRDGRPEDRITRQATCAFELLGMAPTWADFLERVQPDPEIRHWLQRWAGYCLTGSTREQIFVVLHGIGANGKSVFAETLKKLLGGYALSADFSTFTRRDGGSDAIRNDLARLDKSRLVVASEGPEGARLDEDLVKRITGGDEITARFLHREFFSFRPRFKLMLVTNHRPSISGTDHGIWRRVVLVPWEIVIPAEEQDRGLTEKLERELSGILNWALDGLRAYLQVGLLPLPSAIAQANAEYRADSDTVGLWVSDCCELESSLTASAASLYNAYVNWTRDNGHKPLSSKSLGQRLKERGLVQTKQHGVRAWQGIGLR